MTEIDNEYEPKHWVRIKHSRTNQSADGESVTFFWTVESHDDLRAVNTLRHSIVQTYAAHVHALNPKQPDDEPAAESDGQ